MTLHSILVIFKYSSTIIVILDCILYIPFWLYSSKFNYIGIHYGETFTFHSGYIQVKVLFVYIITPPIFTFHSGYIQVFDGQAGRVGHANKLYIPFWLYSSDIVQVVHKYLFLSLHSILVIFKWMLSDLLDLVQFIFTFHSGYIQVSWCSFLAIYFNHLYIPFWLYSSFTTQSFTASYTAFTFHSGYIQVLSHRRYTFSYQPLHSILVIFKLDDEEEREKAATIFTFHSGYIQV